MLEFNSVVATMVIIAGPTDFSVNNRRKWVLAGAGGDYTKRKVKT